MPRYPNFCGGSYTAQSAVANGARTVNWYPERIDVEGESPEWRLYPTPGVQAFGTATPAQGRGHFAYKGRDFAVIGASFVEISSAGVLTVLGTVAVDGNPATMSTNGDGGQQVFVTSGDNGYIFDLLASTFTQVRTGATTMGAHLDGYFLALDAATSTLFLSDLLDGTTWDPTQFLQRSAAADPWVAMKVVGRYVWMLGSDTSDVLYNAGTFPFPLAPHPSGLVPYGCAAAFSPEVVAGALMWLGKTADGHGMVLRSSGFSPEVVSTYALQVQIAGYTSISDAIGDTYQDLGHTFYVLTLVAGNATVCYDVNTGIWHDRGTWISESNRFDACRPIYHSFCFDKHLWLDRSSGTIWQTDASFGYDVDDRPLRRVRRPSAMQDGTRRLLVSNFELYLEPGLGTSTGQGADPQVGMRISVDGGKTFGSERQRSAGAIGAYRTAVDWTRCGSARFGWMPEVVVTDPIPWRLLGAGYNTNRRRA